MIKDEEKWPAMHAYRRAVAAGDAEPIRCPECVSEMVPVLDPRSTGPTLKCLSCNALFVPGVYVWDQIEDAIRELNRNRPSFGV